MQAHEVDEGVLNCDREAWINRLEQEIQVAACFNSAGCELKGSLSLDKDDGAD